MSKYGNQLRDDCNYLSRGAGGLGQSNKVDMMICDQIRNILKKWSQEDLLMS